MWLEEWDVKHCVSGLNQNTHQSYCPEKADGNLIIFHYSASISSLCFSYLSVKQPPQADDFFLPSPIYLHCIPATRHMGYWWGSNVSCLLSPHYLYASPPLPTCHSLWCNAFSQRLSQAKWGVKGIYALDVEPPVLMHFFQFTINVLEIALLDNPFVFSASRVEKQPFISCSDKAK